MSHHKLQQRQTNKKGIISDRTVGKLILVCYLTQSWCNSGIFRQGMRRLDRRTAGWWGKSISWAGESSDVSPTVSTSKGLSFQAGKDDGLWLRTLCQYTGSRAWIAALGVLSLRFLFKNLAYDHWPAGHHPKIQLISLRLGKYHVTESLLIRPEMVWTQHSIHGLWWPQIMGKAAPWLPSGSKVFSCLTKMAKDLWTSQLHGLPYPFPANLSPGINTVAIIKILTYLEKPFLLGSEGER